METDLLEVLPYAALFSMALIPVIVGSRRSVHQTFESAMSTKDALMFPVVASCMLFGLYLLFKFLGKDYVNYLLSLYFLALGTYAVWGTITPLLGVLLPGSIQTPRFRVKVPLLDMVSKLSVLDCLTLPLGFGAAVAYFLTRNWILNNILGLSFSIEAVELVSLGSFKIATLLMAGLFVYDVFWVFGTDVMVTVAKSFEAPIKLLFPRNILEPEKVSSAKYFGLAMLGLGDIVFPGFLIAMLLRFDRSRRRTGVPVYFLTGLASYAVALLVTGVVLHVFRAAQPAMLYIVPCTVVAPVLVALVRGELGALLEYSEHEPEPADAKETAGSGATGAGTGTGTASASGKDTGKPKGT